MTAYYLHCEFCGAWLPVGHRESAGVVAWDHLKACPHFAPLEPLDRLQDIAPDMATHVDKIGRAQEWDKTHGGPPNA
jgi:hypothetical protein